MCSSRTKPNKDDFDIDKALGRIRALHAELTGEYDEAAQDALLDRAFGVDTGAGSKLQTLESQLKPDEAERDALLDKAFGIAR